MNTLALALFCLSAPPQDPGSSLSGDVRLVNGPRCEGATVRLALTPAPAPEQGGFTLSMARQLADAPELVARSDAHGRFRMALTPLHRALASAGGLSFELVVEAPGAARWRRALGEDPSLSDGIEILLHKLPDEALLRITCSKDDGPTHGFAVIERLLQLPGQRRIPIHDVIPLDPTGKLTFTEPPHVPGNRDPMEPWIQGELYQVRILALGCEPLQLTLPPGSHQIRLKPRKEPARPVQLADGTPANPPITAHWQLADKEVQLTFLDPAVEHLGGLAPTRISSAQGSATVRTFQEDDSIQLLTPGSLQTTGHDLTLLVLGQDGQPVHGATVWLSDAAVLAAPRALVPYAVSGPDGFAHLQQVPAGQFRVLAAHPEAGRIEAVVQFGPGSAPARLRLRNTGRNQEPPVEGLPGRLWLDLRTLMREGATLEVGVLKQDQTLVIERFPSIPARLRIEGLWPGSTTLYLRVDERPPLLLGNVLIRPGPGEVITLREPPRRRLLLYLRGQDGQPVQRPRLSLGEGGATSTAPGSHRLFRLVASGQPGLFHAEIQAVGTFRLRIHGDSGDTTELPFPPTTEGDVIDLRLAPASR